MQQAENSEEEFLQLLAELSNNKGDFLDNFTKLNKLMNEQTDTIQAINKVYDALQLDFTTQNLQTTALQRIKNELKIFYANKPSDIYLFKLQGTNSIFMHCFLVIIKGEGILEGGYYSFLLKFPHDYPFSTIEFRTFLPLKHPHIYGNAILCIPTIDPFLKIQNYAVRDLLQTWKAILHRPPNPMSIANTEAFSKWNDEFRRLQARFHSLNNPIHRHWKLKELLEEYDNASEQEAINLIIRLFN